MFPRPYFELDDALTTFYFYLRNPNGGAELGYDKNVTVRYFDDESVFDAMYTFPKLLEIRPRDQFSDSTYPTGSRETRILLNAGNTYTVSVFANY